jgi:hypothetical protein
MIAPACVVTGIRPHERALLRAEYAFDGGVDVEMNLLRPKVAHRREALVHHQGFQIREPLVVETAQVAVQGVQARNDAARQTHEERVRRERFESEHASLPRDVRVHQQAQLRLHRIDNPPAALEPAEPSAKLGIEPLAPAEHAEAREPRGARQRRVASPLVNPCRIRAANATVTMLSVARLPPRTSRRTLWMLVACGDSVLIKHGNERDER